LGSWLFGIQELVEEMEGSIRGWVPLTPPSWLNKDVAECRIRLSVKYIPKGGAQKKTTAADELLQLDNTSMLQLPTVSMLVDDNENDTLAAETEGSHLQVNVDTSKEATAVPPSPEQGATCPKAQSPSTENKDDDDLDVDRLSPRMEPSSSVPEKPREEEGFSIGASAMQSDLQEVTTKAQSRSNSNVAPVTPPAMSLAKSSSLDKEDDVWEERFSMLQTKIGEAALTPPPPLTPRADFGKKKEDLKSQDSSEASGGSSNEASPVLKAKQTIEPLDKASALVQAGLPSRNYAPNPVDQAEALSETYVEVYHAFSEVRTWKAQEDIGTMLAAQEQASLQKALSLSLEAVGNVLQGAVAKAGMEWKSYRTKVVAAVKKSDQTLVLLPTDERVKLPRPNNGSPNNRSEQGTITKRKQCAMGVVARADDVLQRLEDRLHENGASCAVYPQAHSSLKTARDLVRTLAHKLGGS